MASAEQDRHFPKHRPGLRRRRYSDVVLQNLHFTFNEEVESVRFFPLLDDNLPRIETAHLTIPKRLKNRTHRG
jgi:hypothetical protein